MICAYIHRTRTSGSRTRCAKAGMIYSENMAAFEGVMTVTSINTCMSVRSAAARTMAASSCRRSTMYGTIRSSLASSVR